MTNTEKAELIYALNQKVSDGGDDKIKSSQYKYLLGLVANDIHGDEPEYDLTTKQLPEN